MTTKYVDKNILDDANKSILSFIYIASYRLNKSPALAHFGFMPWIFFIGNLKGIYIL